MNKVALKIESSLKYWKRFKNREYNLEELDYRFNMNYSVCMLASNIKAKAIIAYTDTGDTARTVSSFGPECPIFAITENEKTYRQLGLCWNIIPKLFPSEGNIDKLVYTGINTLKNEGFLQNGDTVIIAGGAKVAPTLSDEEASVNTVMGGIVRI